MKITCNGWRNKEKPGHVGHHRWWIIYVSLKYLHLITLLSIPTPNSPTPAICVGRRYNICDVSCTDTRAFAGSMQRSCLYADRALLTLDNVSPTLTCWKVYKQVKMWVWLWQVDIMTFDEEQKFGRVLDRKVLLI